MITTKSSDSAANGWSGSHTRIALVGNPNCGKTTLFNALTGLRYKVANYPGVTVESKSGVVQLEAGIRAEIVDLPGLYSLSATTLDEKVAVRVLGGQLSGEKAPDLIISVIDCTNLQRNLFLATQIIDQGMPTVIALTMYDEAQAMGIWIGKEILARALGVPVVAVIASRGVGLEQLKGEICRMISNPRPIARRLEWLPNDHPFHASAQVVGERLGASGLDALARGALALSAGHNGLAGGEGQVLEAQRAMLREKGCEPIGQEATLRYQWIAKLSHKATRRDDVKVSRLREGIDLILAHRFWGFVMFLFFMAVVFQSVFTLAVVPMNWMDKSVSWLSGVVEGWLSEGPLRSLLVDGVLAGVGSVVIFLPQIAILFFLVSLLEDSGYLARAAHVTDRIMRKFGLQGRSFIPLLSCFACAVPGILATRTIPGWHDRLKTILVAPLMSCSARLPVYSLLIAAFIPPTLFWGVVSAQGLALMTMYVLGAATAMLVAWVLKLGLIQGERSYFVMEMPPYRWPSLKAALRTVYDRLARFVKTTGVIILVCSLGLWFMASYPRGEIEQSYAGRIGRFIEPVLKPLGFNWEIGVGILASFAAREVFVSSLATVYHVADQGQGRITLLEVLANKRNEGSFSLPSALAVLVFFVYACQCVSTLAACRKETGSWLWPGVMFAYMTVLAYLAAFVTYQVSVRLIT